MLKVCRIFGQFPNFCQFFGPVLAFSLVKQLKTPFFSGALRAPIFGGFIFAKNLLNFRMEGFITFMGGG